MLFGAFQIFNFEIQSEVKMPVEMQIYDMLISPKNSYHYKMYQLQKLVNFIMIYNLKQYATLFKYKGIGKMLVILCHK